MSQVTNNHIASEDSQQLPPPNIVKDRYHDSSLGSQTSFHRTQIERILTGADKRLLVIVGPCSIHHMSGALNYAKCLADLSDELEDELLIVMRTYFAKPRTIVGWKGLFYDPSLSGTEDVSAGAFLVRKIAYEIACLGVPIATEVLDSYMIQYIDDLVSWSCIGARTVESQPHRELASGLSMPVGFKNGTDGSTKTAIDAVEAASHPHHFFGMDEGGLTHRYKSTGNPYGHVVLRGGTSGPNFSEASVLETTRVLKQRSLASGILVDCSHGNSNKDFTRQGDVVEEILRQRHEGVEGVVGVMLESNLKPGSQPFPQTPEEVRRLDPGTSITDGCIGWDETAELLRNVAAQVKAQ